MAMGSPTWTREPVRLTLREIQESPAFDEAVKSHVLRWAEDLTLPDNPVVEAIVSEAIYAYAQSRQLRAKGLRTGPEGKGAITRDRRIMQLAAHHARMFRLSGIGRKQGKERGGGLPSPPIATSPQVPSATRDLPPDLGAGDPEANGGAAA